MGIKLEHSQLIFYRMNCRILYVSFGDRPSPTERGGTCTGRNGWLAISDETKMLQFVDCASINLMYLAFTELLD